MNEFDLISTLFRPLAKDFPGSLNLSDDAAIISPPAGFDLVVTKDAISEGVHFIGKETPARIAKKLLRVNLSDLAAMGAKPLVYLLAIMIPKTTEEAWIQSFAQGLRDDQEQFGIHLIGGDTIATKGALSFSLTAFGTVPSGKALRRSGAKPGDHIYVSGTLGDSALGLKCLQGTIARYSFLEGRYLLPEPRLELGQKLLGIAHAAMDISDGLLQDLGHICETSNVGATIKRPLLPLSQAAKNLISSDKNLWDAVTGGGDDYELLFTAPPEESETIKQLSEILSLPISMIGEIHSGSGIKLLDENEIEIKTAKKGFSHF